MVPGVDVVVRGDENREASLQILAQQLVGVRTAQRLAGSVRVLCEVGQRHLQQVESHAAVDGEPSLQRIRAQVPVIDTWRWAADDRGQAVDPNSDSQNSAARSALTDGTPQAASRRPNWSFADTTNTIAPARTRQA